MSCMWFLGLAILGALLVQALSPDLLCCSDKYGRVIDIAAEPIMSYAFEDGSSISIKPCVNGTGLTACGFSVAACLTEAGGDKQDLSLTSGTWIGGDTARYNPINPGTGHFTEVRVTFICDSTLNESKITTVDIVPNFNDTVTVTLYNATVRSPLAGVCSAKSSCKSGGDGDGGDGDGGDGDGHEGDNDDDLGLSDILAAVASISFLSWLVVLCVAQFCAVFVIAAAFLVLRRQ